MSALLLGLLPIGAAHAQAQELPAEAPLPLDPQVTIGTLENGLRYYVRSNARPENRAELRLVIKAGSILEDEEQRGLAHFLEHMAFNGTRNFEEHELVRYLEGIGMRFGPDLNAYTSFDETVYMLTVPTDRVEILSTAFQILSDWADGITLDPAAIERERPVVIEEWRGRLGVQSRLSDAQIPVLLGGSRYAERLPIGRVETLETFPPEALSGFYERWYRPDLMAVVAVGDFDPEVVESLIGRYFGSLPVPVAELDRPRFPVPPPAATVVHTTTDPELTTTRVEVHHRLPAREVRTVADQREVLLERLYSSMLNTRLGEITQKPNAPFIAASTGRGSLVRGADMYSLVALVADDGIERGLEALLTESERVARFGFTTGELDRAVSNLLRGIERAYAERARTNSGALASAYVSNFLASTPIPGIEFEYELAQRLLPEVSLEEVNRLSTVWFADRNRMILVSAPRRDDLELPDESRLLASLAAVEAAPLAPYDDHTRDEPLVASMPLPGRVVEEIHHPAIDVVEWRLENGARVLLKETRFRDDEVIFRATAPGGASLADDRDYVSASLATDVIRASGVGSFSAIDLERALSGKAANVAPFIGDLEQGFTGSASPSDLEALFQLVHLHFTAPRNDPEAVSAMMEQLTALLANRNADPAAAFSDTLQVTLTQRHPRARVFDSALLAELEPDVAHAFFRDRFADVSGFTFVLVGNLDLQEVRPLVESYLGSLPAAGRVDVWRDHGVRPPEGVIEKIVRKGLEPRATSQIVFSGPLEFTRERAYAIRALAAVLDVRLRDILREDLGGTYAVQVSGSASRLPVPQYSFGIGFGSSPERVEELVQVVFREIDRLREEGVAADEVARVKELHRRERETSLRQNGYWAGQLIGQVRDSGELSRILDYEALIENLDAADIQEAARLVLRPDRYVRVSLLPEER